MVKRNYQIFILIGVCLILAFLFWNGRRVEGFEAPPEVVAPDVKLADIPIIKDIWIINLNKFLSRPHSKTYLN